MANKRVNLPVAGKMSQLFLHNNSFHYYKNVICSLNIFVLHFLLLDYTHDNNFLRICKTKKKRNKNLPLTLFMPIRPSLRPQVTTVAAWDKVA